MEAEPTLEEQRERDLVHIEKMARRLNHMTFMLVGYLAMERKPWIRIIQTRYPKGFGIRKSKTTKF